ncbi:hypothetical protein [Agriterribacter sp.]|nr:hypothetical protein [Agriterribacter sp.]HRO46229.1 hypothetical protein [Agriterribacter sp.]HRQ18490.1 hypothetical protein [Agriterribacter sp.]
MENIGDIIGGKLEAVDETTGHDLINIKYQKEKIVPLYANDAHQAHA